MDNMRRRLRNFSASPRLLISLTTTLFVGTVAFDLTQTLNTARNTLETNVRIVAAQLANVSADGAAPLVAATRDALAPNVLVTLSDWSATARRDAGFVLATVENGAKFAPELTATRHIVGPLGEVSLSSPLIPILIPVAQRAGLIALGLFALLILAIRRGEAALVGAMGGREFADLLSDFRAGVACFTPGGRLIGANTAFRSRLSELKSNLKPGARHDQIIEAIAKLGRIEVLQEEQGYRLSQFRGDDIGALGFEEIYSSNGALLLVLSDRAEQLSLNARIDAMHKEMAELAQSVQQHKMIAEAAKRSTKSFLAHLNHEIRTPLNHIIGFADLIKHQSYGPLGDKRYVTYVGHIKQSGENLLSGISKILELGEFETGQFAVKKERIGVSELLAWASHRYRDGAERAGIRFNVDTDCSMEIEVDRMLMQRMLGNVLENAMRFTTAGGEVAFKAWTADSGVVFEISDTGIGIGPERLEILSQTFLLGPTSFKLDQSKTGTGIAISRAIAELSGGQFAIDSSLNIGTTIAISMPATTSEAAVPSRRAA